MKVNLAKPANGGLVALVYHIPVGGYDGCGSGGVLFAVMVVVGMVLG